MNMFRGGGYDQISGTPTAHVGETSFQMGGAPATTHGFATRSVSFQPAVPGPTQSFGGGMPPQQASNRVGIKLVLGIMAALLVIVLIIYLVSPETIGLQGYAKCAFMRW